ncbi:blr2393 [Bradyrhizobium diazoefficiens USDA 110]|uniref:Blr2393 protein n=2 Tax=Bradyrhizobium diazoefficiens TaxID=1355477 RepID=Q89SK7_BRADU|nr:DoxX family protein [Bradyrhizobium diazoefficiens]QBP21217.1 DoxX family protein [Bradyrhizobium diazoefficiens]BAC47658.1 blr2393 [Bradyrhizobium diazoefficiens USDA 110]
MTKRASFAAPTSRQERFVRSTNHDRIALGSQSVQPVLDNKGGGSAMKSNSVSRAVDEFATGSADSLILIGRVLLAWVFVGSAYGAISDFSGSVGYFRSLHLPAPELFTMTNIALEVLISVGLILGVGTRYCAILTFVFVVAATAIAHRYWEYPAGAQQIGQYNHFLKNISIMGGAMLIFVTGAGRFSFDRAS